MTKNEIWQDYIQFTFSINYSNLTPFQCGIIFFLNLSIEIIAKGQGNLENRALIMTITWNQLRVDYDAIIQPYLTLVFHRQTSTFSTYFHNSISNSMMQAIIFAKNHIFLSQVITLLYKLSTPSFQLVLFGLNNLCKI